MKIYTKTGDKGKTSLVDGSRVDKFDLRLEAYGTVDELNSLIGIVISETGNTKLKKSLKRIQNELFQLGSMLATPKENKEFKPFFTDLGKDKIQQLENEIDEYSQKLSPLKAFVLPGGTKGSAYLHLARTVVRRAERAVLRASKIIEIDEEIIIYLNRLSDLFFTMARFENFTNKVDDIYWEK